MSLLVFSLLGASPANPSDDISQTKRVPFLEQHAIPIINYYDIQAKRTKREYFLWQSVVIIIGVVIPVVNVTNFADDAVRYASAILGGAIAAITSILQLRKSHELWLSYTTTTNRLHKEFELYLYEVGDYGKPEQTKHDKLKLFVEKFESIVEESGKESTELFKKKENTAK